MHELTLIARAWPRNSASRKASFGRREGKRPPSGSFSFTQKRYAETRDPSLIWEGHKAGREIGYCHLEKLHNLEVLPATGFLVCCFPVKVRAGSAGWTRAVAFLND